MLHVKVKTTSGRHNKSAVSIPKIMIFNTWFIIAFTNRIVGVFIMRIRKLNECKVIKTTEPADFEQQFRSALEGVKDPQIMTDYKDGFFVAIITWQTDAEVVETVRDEFHLEGLRYVCGQCPYLEHDGDGRKKRFPCKYAEYGTARVDSECCEMFYRQLKQGVIHV